MLSQDEYPEDSDDNESMPIGVSNSNLSTEENSKSMDASSEKANTSLLDTSCTQHLPRTIQGILSAVIPERQNTHRKSARSCSHFLSRDIPSSDEQIILEFFLDIYRNEKVAKACAEEQLSSLRRAMLLAL
jgi:hypothetical protein